MSRVDVNSCNLVEERFAWPRAVPSPRYGRCLLLPIRTGVLELKIVRTLAITAALGSFAALGTIPAQAATGYNRCPPNRFCVFPGLNGTGVIAIYTKSDPSLGDAGGPRGMNNNIESGWNRRA